MRAIKAKAEARQRRRSAAKAIAAYYSSLSRDERDEQEAWGDFALTQLPAEATQTLDSERQRST